MLPEDIFPYPSFRQGQKELAQSVYLACKNGQRFVAEAMSGFGKTGAVLAGSMSAAAEDDLELRDEAGEPGKAGADHTGRLQELRGDEIRRAR